MIEQIRLWLYHIDAQTFLLATHYMDRFELAALYTLQHGLARDSERTHRFAHRQEVFPSILAESRLDVISQPYAPGCPGRELLAANEAIIEQAMQCRRGNAERLSDVWDEHIWVADVGEAASIVNAVPAQVLAYELALLRGLDPDKPRNLAKSVTGK